MDYSIEEKVLESFNLRYPNGTELEKLYVKKLCVLKFIDILLKSKITINNLLNGLEYSHIHDKEEKERSKDYEPNLNKKTAYPHPYFRMSLEPKIKKSNVYLCDRTNLKSLASSNDINQIKKTKEKLLYDIKTFEDKFKKLLTECDIILDKYKIFNFLEHDTDSIAEIFNYIQEFCDCNFN